MFYNVLGRLERVQSALERTANELGDCRELRENIAKLIEAFRNCVDVQSGSLNNYFCVTFASFGICSVVSCGTGIIILISLLILLAFLPFSKVFGDV